MKTIDQLKIKNIKIGSALKAKCLHYLEPVESLGKGMIDQILIELKENEIITLLNIEDHPFWSDCYLVQVLYDCRILWLSISKHHLIGVMTEEFELIV